MNLDYLHNGLDDRIPLIEKRIYTAIHAILNDCTPFFTPEPVERLAPPSPQLLASVGRLVRSLNPRYLCAALCERELQRVKVEAETLHESLSSYAGVGRQFVSDKGSEVLEDMEDLDDMYGIEGMNEVVQTLDLDVFGKLIMLSTYPC